MLAPRTERVRKVSKLFIAVTGASGRLARSIVPDLVRAGLTPVLFGRDTDRLRALFPELESYRNDEIEPHLGRMGGIVHLAAINNDAGTDALPDLRRVNVEWPIKLAQAAQRAGVRRFVFVSSTHTLEPGTLSAYAQSKRDAADGLRKIGGIAVSEIVAPKIYDARRGAFYLWLWRTLSAVKPTASTAELSDAVVRELCDGSAVNRTVLLSKRYHTPLAYRVFTFMVDISFALAVLIVFGWLLVLVAIAVRLDSPGPALFRQTRVGKDQALFVCWKFRTMHLGSAHRATHEMTTASITKVGAFLRKSKLDELPQAINLLRRELSLVGPRPCLPSQTKLVSERAARGVYRARPGITGLAQINGVDMSDPMKLAIWDERYISLRSGITDLKVILATFVGNGRGDHVGAGKDASRTSGL